MAVYKNKKTKQSTKGKDIGKILITDDKYLSTDGYSKKGRRVVITDDDGKNIKVNKITKDKDYVKGATDASRKKQKEFTTKIDYKKYPNALNLPSVVDKKQHTINQMTKTKISKNDKEFIDTNERLNKRDRNKVKKLIKK